MKGQGRQTLASRLGMSSTKDFYIVSVKCKIYYKESKGSSRMEEKIIKSVIPIYAVGILWTLYSFVFSMHTTRNITIASIICFLAYSILSDIIPHQIIKVKIKEDPANTGNNIADEYINTGREYRNKLKELEETLRDTSVDIHIQCLENNLIKILELIEQNPEKARYLRTFIDYYLPTTIKLLESYDHLSSQDIDGENIDNSLSKIEGAMHSMVDAFTRQIDNFFEEKALDINAEINVLKDILEREGLAESDMSINTKKVDIKGES